MRSFAVRIIAVALSLAFLAAPAIADKAERILTEGFIAYEQARLVGHTSTIKRNYLLALGPYEKRYNRWQPEASARLSGLLTRYTYEIPAGADEADVFQFYLDQLPESAQTLYQCRAMHCGNSNNWANDHFRIKQLYGLDQYQFYGVYRLVTGETVTLYTVRRGNRRIYSHIDLLSPE